RGSMPVERLLPPPETPLPRPATTSNPTPAAPAPAVAVPAPQAPTATPAPAPAAAAPQQPQTAAVPAPSVGTGERLQVGAVKTPEIAKSEWDRIKRQNSDLVGSLTVSVDRADLGDRGVFYRIHVGPIADAGQAERLCAQLRQRGVGCIIAKP